MFSLRVFPLSFDAQCNIYYMLSDCRKRSISLLGSYFSTRGGTHSPTTPSNFRMT